MKTLISYCTAQAFLQAMVPMAHMTPGHSMAVNDDSPLPHTEFSNLQDYLPLVLGEFETERATIERLLADAGAADSSSPTGSTSQGANLPGTSRILLRRG